MLSKALDPPLVLFKLCSLRCGACEYLYITALKLVCSDYLDRFSGNVAVDSGLYLLPSPRSWVCSVALGGAMVLKFDRHHSVFVCRYSW